MCIRDRDWLLWTPWVRFIAFLPCFLHFIFSPAWSRYVFSSSCCFVCAAAAVICYCTLSKNLIVRVILSCVICILFHLRSTRFFHSSSVFFVVPISRVTSSLLCSRTRYSINSTWFDYIDSLATNGFSVSLFVTTKFVSLQDEESGKTLGVLLMSLGRKNGWEWRQQQ